MINLKSKKQILDMKHGGKILREVADELEKKIKSGMTTLEIDVEAEKMILDRGAMSSFKKVTGYSWTTCQPINEQAVHTIPSSQKLEDGDVYTLDIGVYYAGLHTDYATTFIVGEKKDDKVQSFLRKGESTLLSAIKKIKAGVRMGVVSQYIQNEIEGAGYFILKDLTGHGIGKELHEDPYVLNYLDRPIEKTKKFASGLTIAVEIIYSMGTEEIAYEPGRKWSIITKDRSLSACFERSIAVEDEETFILT